MFFFFFVKKLQSKLEYKVQCLHLKCSGRKSTLGLVPPRAPTLYIPVNFTTMKVVITLQICKESMLFFLFVVFVWSK